MPASCSWAWALSRLVLSMLTRRSSGALVGHRRDELPEALVVEVVLERAGQPVGHVVAQLLGERVAVDRAHAVEPLLLVLAHAAADQRLVALPGQDRQAALERAAAALGQVLEQQALAQHRVGRLGQRVALARAQLAVLAEEVRDDDVRGHVETGRPRAAVRWRCRGGRSDAWQVSFAVIAEMKPERRRMRRRSGKKSSCAVARAPARGNRQAQASQPCGSLAAVRHPAVLQFAARP